jgi:hypothetical protein
MLWYCLRDTAEEGRQVSAGKSRAGN